jgi:hypothetical protein
MRAGTPEKAKPVELAPQPDVPASLLWKLADGALTLTASALIFILVNRVVTSYMDKNESAKVGLSFLSLFLVVFAWHSHRLCALSSESGQSLGHECSPGRRKL